MPEKTAEESFKEELEALLAKYPSIRFQVTHNITITEIGQTPVQPTLQ